MTSIADHNDAAYSGYAGANQFVVSLGIISQQLNNIPMVQHALKDLN